MAEGDPGERTEEESVLLISILLAILPLVGIAWFLITAPGMTVDNLFTTLILLAISSVFGINVLMELYQRGLLPSAKPKPQAAGAAGYATSAKALGFVALASANGVLREKCFIQSVDFYEASVGQHDKSVVTLRPDGGKSTKMVVFLGDLRNALQPGKKAVITYRAEGEGFALLGQDYS